MWFSCNTITLTPCLGDVLCGSLVTQLPKRLGLGDVLCGSLVTQLL